MSNILIATNALLSILQQATALGTLLQTANAQGRDLTPEELAQVQSDYAANHAKLDQDIAAAGTTAPGASSV